MTADHPLFSFMPYGAPELLRDARGNLFRATLLSTIGAGFTLALAVTLAGLIPVEPPVTVIVPPTEHAPLPVPVSPRPRSTDPAVLRPPVAAGRVMPVDESLVPDDAPVAEPGDAPVLPGPGSGAGVAEPQGGSVVMPPDEPPFPEWNEPVYVEELPSPVVDPRPEYPEIAKAAGVEGTVLVHVLVDREGRVARAFANSKRTVPLLEAAAVEAARRWVFHPALVNRRPVAVWVAIPFEFRLR